MAESKERGGLRRLLSPRLLWQAMKLPWYVWAAAAAVSLVAVYVLFQKIIVYAVIVAVVFFGSRLVVGWFQGRKGGGAAALPKDGRPDWKRELDIE